MNLILASIAVLFLSSLVSLAVQGKPRIAGILGACGSVLALGLGIVPAVQALMGSQFAPLAFASSMPWLSFSMGLDPISAIFLVPIYILSGLVAVYGTGYMKPYAEQKNTAFYWFFYNILVASMVLVCVARNGLFFLLCWEVMALSSFFLVAFENDKVEVRKASWIYLIASQLGTVFLIPMFILFGNQSGSFEFSSFYNCLTPAAATGCFILGCIGFGTKAGIIPFHVWLPEAHPAAPSPVSALMSGVMIKTGIYGLVRMITFLGMPPLWWGMVLIAIGALSGILGVLFALAQHDIKRLLAYHSVENIGIIVLGIGVGLIGISTGHQTIAVLGFAGGLLHVINHALFKGLLFLGAGSVIHQTHTREIDHMGGLIKKMPITALTFLIGAVAISGLPPLNGFVSEFLVYMGSFSGITSLEAETAMPLAGVIASLALIGGLATACFTKVFGIVFLGEARTIQLDHVQESPASMTVPMIILAFSCVVIGLSGPLVVRLLIPEVLAIVPISGPFVFDPSEWLVNISIVASGLVVLIILGAGFRKFLLSRRTVGQTVTWDCGYAAPFSRMQYTASSFAQPLTDLFSAFLKTKKHIKVPADYFPAQASIETHTADPSNERVYRPVFAQAVGLLSRMRALQQGRIQIYVLYIVVTLIALLLWKLR
ncbi:MAG: hypothetical protein A2268_12425 [Candidatus Raymondbacteria bacterium RifOxyA12_full_50_37]|uniref:NADH:quinone oxidoreductase/Mrp antiporter membrane subunit domain-containing protein n=1 Tax=Candidatus Raymondbacteria bacterium RIFOXYD12_FULL_49_13 TaxID=1817890 RepID=A0A1F7F8S8_UNCRA|nr:MAG: hypothetical protein A2268_12425 [Candidatus Raymondbacteria bacterium RifOxyA12_full_50_37]OGJ91344.1 MAG: hypothetical protein A2248_03920 [Candidatus Raymondbacteria bacterium RIFOXYA2_FULL_49_16]OGJ91562.1 MAG: hypothetical protein A2350_11780 [Candidatus Raymondbacteria bacterium RifOxyB12_full_50_8]OGJ97751.1 MAG: hypothetical protein A2453_13800 [Candidatus Raymondbacteria bacterium RIFOXYC2_FULL_50_21]OGK00147.1 MAG: hypothetical protein A2487_09530 [Candidatus Raymondbacteria b